jgi:hypothetical protein
MGRGRAVRALRGHRPWRAVDQLQSLTAVDRPSRSRFSTQSQNPTLWPFPAGARAIARLVPHISQSTTSADNGSSYLVKPARAEHAALMLSPRRKAPPCVPPRDRPTRRALPASRRSTLMELVCVHDVERAQAPPDGP